MTTALSSAPSLGIIHQAVTDFYGGTPFTLVETGVGTWALRRVSDGLIMTHVHVARRRKRFYFEMF
jgi:hypothetical protein